MNPMDIPMDIARRLLPGWQTHNRHLRLHWSGDLDAELQSVLLPQSASIREGINTGVELRISCFVLDAALPLNDFLGQHIALKMLTHDGMRSFPAIITDMIAGRYGGAARMATLVARDPLSILAARKRLRVFKNKSTLEVACAVFDEWIASGGLGGAFGYQLLNIARERYPRRGHFIQFPDESDAEFVNRLLQPSGISCCWMPVPNDDEPNAVPLCTLVLFDDGWQLPANPFGSLPYLHRETDILGEGIHLLSQAWQMVPDGVSLQVWDHEAARAEETTSPTGVEQGPAGNKLARLLRDTRLPLPHLGDDGQDRQALADVHSNHHIFRSYGLKGRSSVRTLAAGTHAPIHGYTAFSGQTADERDHLIVKVEHWALNNLPAELHEATQSLIGEDPYPNWVPLGPDGKPQAPYVNRFEAVHRTVAVVPTYISERDSPAKRRLTGIVVALDGDGEVTTDSLGRSLVRLIGAEPGLDTTVWVRHASPWAGRDHGFMAQIRADTEVDLEAFGDDRLVIVGSHYNGVNRPPSVNHQPSLPANRFQTAIVAREIDSNSQQHLLFDDMPGQQMAQLATDVDNSALSIGAITTPRNEGQAQHRGRGTELRSDAVSVMRAAEGMLMTTEGRPNAQGHITDMPETIDRLTQSQALHRNLGDAAAQAQAQQSGDQDEVAQALERQVKELKGRGTPPDQRGRVAEFQAPHLALASPAGIQTTTQGSTHVASAEHNALTSGGHTSISAHKSLLVSVKEAVKLFAYSAGMKLIAAAGDIDLKALKHSINILAKLNITQTAKTITIQAEEKLVLGGGGSTITLDASTIDSRTSGTWMQQAASHSISGPANGPTPTLPNIDVALKETPPEHQVALSMHALPGLPVALLANQPCTVLKNGAEFKKCMFDAYGRLTIDKVEKGDHYQVKLANGTIHDLPVAPERMQIDPEHPDYHEHRLSNKGYRADGLTAAERLAQLERGADPA